MKTVTKGMRKKYAGLSGSIDEIVDAIFSVKPALPPPVERVCLCILCKEGVSTFAYARDPAIALTEYQRHDPAVQLSRTFIMRDAQAATNALQLAYATFSSHRAKNSEWFNIQPEEADAGLKNALSKVAHVELDGSQFIWVPAPWWQNPVASTPKVKPAAKPAKKIKPEVVRRVMNLGPNVQLKHKHFIAAKAVIKQQEYSDFLPKCKQPVRAKRGGVPDVLTFGPCRGCHQMFASMDALENHACRGIHALKKLDGRPLQGGLMSPR